MHCLVCNFYDKNDPHHAWGTCEPQDEDFHATHKCNLPRVEIKEIESLLKKTQISRQYLSDTMVQ